jgi:hypothetical protein
MTKLPDNSLLNHRFLSSRCQIYAYIFFKPIDMMQKQALQLFEDIKVLALWDSEQEKWYFSIVDTIGVLTDSLDTGAYWRKLKQRLKAEGNEM